MKYEGPSRAIIDLDAYAHNLGVVRNFAGPKRRIIAVIKADGYGHGAVPLGRAALRAGAGMLGVATVQEAVVLRAAGIDAPILVMVNPHADGLGLVVEHRLTLMISDIATAQRLGELAREAGRVTSVHCKVDTGMGRQGFAANEAPDALQAISRITHIDIEGIATHFPSSDVPDDPFTLAQIKVFRQAVREIEKRGIPFEFAHAANSAAIINYPDSLFDAVRPGLISYGVWPVADSSERSPLRRVLRWETHVVQVRDLPDGASIGYNRSFTANGPIRIAVLPVGYADGYRRHLSNNADVLLRGRRCPVRGIISMDQTVVDVSALPEVHPGDTATLIGGDGDETVTAEELARRAGTISYDILTGIGKRVVREYTGGGEEE
jgi:alanine racemase